MIAPDPGYPMVVPDSPAALTDPLPAAPLLAVLLAWVLLVAVGVGVVWWLAF